MLLITATIREGGAAITHNEEELKRLTTELAMFEESIRHGLTTSNIADEETSESLALRPVGRARHRSPGQGTPI
jgi:hypothetical protein